MACGLETTIPCFGFLLQGSSPNTPLVQKQAPFVQVLTCGSYRIVFIKSDAQIRLIPVACPSVETLIKLVGVDRFQINLVALREGRVLYGNHESSGGPREIRMQLLFLRIKPSHAVASYESTSRLGRMAVELRFAGEGSVERRDAVSITARTCVAAGWF